MAGKGRPTKFTEETRKKILKSVSEGNYDYIAARAAGVSRQLLGRWKTRGRKEKTGEFADFLSALTNAENNAEIEAISRIRHAGYSDPKYMQWWAERKFPERWGRDTYQIKLMQGTIDKLAAQVEALVAASQKHQAVTGTGESAKTTTAE